MRHAQGSSSSGTSVEVRVAAGMVGAGALLGVLLLVAGGMLFTADPGFLFAVLPAIMGALIVAGFQLVTVSVSLSRRLLKHAAGARLQAAIVGGCLVLSGLFGATIEPLIGLPLACYGAVLFWLMTTTAAGRDLGPWLVVRARGQRPQRDVWFMPRSMPTRLRSADQPPPYFMGTDVPPAAWQQPQRTWIELWQEGLSQPFPILDFVALCIALPAFAVGDVLLLVGLFGRDALLPLAVVLIGSAVAVVTLVERRLKARLGYA
jgi:hypothetical protein